MRVLRGPLPRGPSLLSSFPSVACYEKPSPHFRQSVISELLATNPDEIAMDPGSKHSVVTALDKLKNFLMRCGLQGGSLYPPVRKRKVLLPIVLLLSAGLLLSVGRYE